MIRKIFATVQDFLSKKNGTVLDSGNDCDAHKKECVSEEGKMWDAIASNCCPCCDSENKLGVVATGGLSLNIRCFECDSLFWLTCERVFGVKILENGKD